MSKDSRRIFCSGCYETGKIKWGKMWAMRDFGDQDKKECIDFVQCVKSTNKLRQ